jgi:hypothetical protein
LLIDDEEAALDREVLEMLVRKDVVRKDVQVPFSITYRASFPPSGITREGVFEQPIVIITGVPRPNARGLQELLRIR